MAKVTSKAPKKSPAKPRVPQPTENIDVNFCKNPQCRNYGIPASPDPPSRGRYANPEKQDRYVLGSKNPPHLICKECGAEFPIKSNQGVYEELNRCTRPGISPDPACSNKQCPNFGKSLYVYPKLYRKSGTSAAGSQRFRCKGKYQGKKCTKTISIPKTKSPVEKQSTSDVGRSSINRLFFRCLANKCAVRNLMDIFELGMGTVYDKIDFLYEQCAKFIEKREAALFKGSIFLDKLYISVDRQVYTVNWKVLKDRRNERLYAIGAADNYSGYVFHMDANYDPWLSYAEIGEALEGTNDEAKPHPFQRFARVWLPNEFMVLYLKAKQKAEERSCSRRGR